jgi:hypothetical protein
MADEAGSQKSGQDAPDGEKKSPSTAAPETPATEAKADEGDAKADKGDTKADKGDATSGKADAKAADAEAAKAKKATPAPPSEDEINAPDWKTLTLLFVIFGVTATSWGAARFSCNMHPPESKPPPKLTVDRLAANPKDAAIEFIQRARSNDYDGALQLALRDARTELESARAQCRTTAAECARKREAMAGLLTTAVVERLDASTADAVATTHFKGEKKTYRVKLARDGVIWKVTEYRPE